MYNLFKFLIITIISAVFLFAAACGGGGGGSSSGGSSGPTLSGYISDWNTYLFDTSQIGKTLYLKAISTYDDGVKTKYKADASTSCVIRSTDGYFSIVLNESISSAYLTEMTSAGMAPFTVSPSSGVYTTMADYGIKIIICDSPASTGWIDPLDYLSDIVDTYQDGLKIAELTYSTGALIVTGTDTWDDNDNGKNYHCSLTADATVLGGWSMIITEVTDVLENFPDDYNVTMTASSTSNLSINGLKWYVDY